MWKPLLILAVFLLLAPAIARGADGYQATKGFTFQVQHNTLLTWTLSPTPGVVGYWVFRGTTTGGEGTASINTTLVAAGIYIDLAVTPGQHYCYTVVAVASDGITRSGPSNEACDDIPSP